MGASHCAMACLAWIASELGSATSFPKENIIPQKPQREEREERGLSAVYATVRSGLQTADML